MEVIQVGGDKNNPVKGKGSVDPSGFDETVMFRVKSDEDLSIPSILQSVYKALEEKGYQPINQMVGYLLSGDPAYITSHHNARNLIRKLDRDELLEELLRHYLATKS